jgi:hypothetical protein
MDTLKIFILSRFCTYWNELLTAYIMSNMLNVERRITHCQHISILIATDRDLQETDGRGEKL